MNTIQNQAEMARCGFSTISVGPAGGLFVNRNIAIAKDFIFGLTCWDGETWVPLSTLDYSDLVHVRQLIDGDTTFIWNDQLAELIRAKIEASGK